MIEAPEKRLKGRVLANLQVVDGYPQGYGKVAAFEACDPNLLIYRKFAWLHNRLLLHYQDELVQLEKELEQIDQHHFREDPERLVSRRRDDVSPEPRTKDILKNIDAKLAQYRRSAPHKLGSIILLNYRCFAPAYAEDPCDQKADPTQSEHLMASNHRYSKPNIQRVRVGSSWSGLSSVGS